nr:MAG TPA: hypothetical protein [Caudoviricetes sp.]
MENPYFNYNLTNEYKKAMKLSRIPSQNKQILLVGILSRQCKDSYFFTYIQLCAALNYLRYIYNKVYNCIQITFKRYSNAV